MKVGQRVYGSVSLQKGVTSTPTFALERQLPFSEKEIAKLTPAVPAHGFISVAVSDDGLKITGIDLDGHLDSLTGVAIESYAPGVARVDIGSFRPYVVFAGRTTMFTEAAGDMSLAWLLQKALRKALPAGDILETQAVWRECLALADLRRHIVEHGHGGALLIVPNDNNDWLQSLDPFALKLAKVDTSVRDAIRHALNETHAQGEAMQRLYASALTDVEKNASITGFVQSRGTGMIYPESRVSQRWTAQL